MDHFKSYLRIREVVLNDDTRNRLKNQQIASAVEKSEKEKEIFQLKNVELKSAYNEIRHKNKEITETRLLEFAGAYFPLYVIRNGSLQVLKVDRMPVCYYHEKMETQKELLHDQFFQWKGEIDQYDDVVILGVKI